MLSLIASGSDLQTIVTLSDSDISVHNFKATPLELNQQKKSGHQKTPIRRDKWGAMEN
jgi:hypothetical protein